NDFWPGKWKSVDWSERDSGLCMHIDCITKVQSSLSNQRQNANGFLERKERGNLNSLLTINT
ncbi:MAG: hypothetical protein ABIV51_14420, partial [Saprospiraceae bacterium]